ncbi:hypothetical protein BKA70DRAFT_663177 [Coprinopsis sp. MPI-PUGE-AT-0042]|nr:hypothetical protein BKA70DRAFT_663177 [Coprinopsis sp. MPI-PUGE-AT-0042]
MASFNLTVEDSSPLLTYLPAGAWQDSPTDDPLISSYSGTNFHRTNVEGATAAISFHGTGVTVMGGRRTGYGSFAATVDGRTIATGAASTSADSTQQILATVSGLALGDHQLVVTNTGADGAQLDIDSIIVADQLGVAGSRINLKNIDDSDAALTYLPSAQAWNVNAQDVYQGGTLRYSEDPNAAVSLAFEGEAVAVYGTMSPDHANMKITIDGQEAILGGGGSTQISRLHTKTLLYFKTGLGPGRHTFSLASENPSPQAPFIDLDAVAILSAASPTAPVVPGSNNNVNPSSTPVFSGIISPSGTPFVSNDVSSGNAASGSQRGGGLSKGAIIGISVGGAVGLIVLLGLCYFAFLLRRRSKSSNRGNGPTPPLMNTNTGSPRFGLGRPRSTSPLSPDLPMQQDPRSVEAGMVSGPMENSVFVFPPPKAAVAPLPSPKGWRTRAGDERHSIAPSYYGSPASGKSYNLPPRPDTASSQAPLMPDSAGSPLGPRSMRLPIPKVQVKVQPPTPITPPVPSSAAYGYPSMPSGSGANGYSRIHSPHTSPQTSYQQFSPRMATRNSPNAPSDIILEEERDSFILSPQASTVSSPMSSPRMRRNPSRDLTTRVIPPRKPVPAFSPDEYGTSPSSTIIDRLNRSPRPTQRTDGYI